MISEDDLPPWNQAIANAVINSLTGYCREQNWGNPLYPEHSPWVTVATIVFIQSNGCKSLDQASAMVRDAVRGPLPLQNIEAAMILNDWQSTRSVSK